MIKNENIKDKIILISIDTLRFDCVGYQSNKNELKKHDVLRLLNTPTLDEIARKSICFTNVISVSTYTTSAHASILTGLYPPKHGIRAFYDTKLSEKVFSLAEILKKEGYITILSTDILELFKPLDLTRGFSHIFTRQDKDLYNFLDKNKDNKVFLFAHFFDVHEPYLLSDYDIYPGYNSDYYNMINLLYKKYYIENKNNIIETYKPRELWNNIRDKLEKNINILLPYYIRGVTKFDNGRFREFINNLRSNGYIDNSLLMIFSDHGEGRSIENNNNIFSHGGFPYDNVIRVPLILYYNGIEPDIIDKQASIVDIFPTVLEKVMHKNSEYLSYKTDGENLFNKKNDHVIGEIWGSNFNFCATDNGLKIPEKNIEWILNYRFIRTKDRKYIIYVRNDAFLEKSIFNIPNDELVKKFYRCILGRIEDKNGFEYHLKNLNLKILSKKDLMNSFLSSEEYVLKKKFDLFDLENDPEELNSIDILKNHFYMFEFCTYIGHILKLEKSAVSSKKIFDDNYLEEEKIKERLKKLGYLK